MKNAVFVLFVFLLPAAGFLASCTGTGAPAVQDSSPAIPPKARSKASLRFVRFVHVHPGKPHALDSYAELSLHSDAGRVTVPVETIDGKSFVTGFGFSIQTAEAGTDRWDESASVGSDAMPPDKLVIESGETRTFYAAAMDTPEPYDQRICVWLEEEDNHQLCSQGFRTKNP